MTKIITKKGDKGTTDLYKKRINKISEEISFIGDLDELISYLGICRYYFNYLDLDKIQILLSNICATVGGYETKINWKSELNWLEEKCEMFNKQIKVQPKNWFYFDNNLGLCHLNYTRSLIRKCEIKSWKFEKVDININKFLNRLSDYLYIVILSKIEE